MTGVLPMRETAPVRLSATTLDDGAEVVNFLDGRAIAIDENGAAIADATVEESMAKRWRGR